MSDGPETLSPEESARLTDFARACKAAARAVTLYPGGHPAIASSIGRLAQLTAAHAMPSPITLSVLPGDIRIGGRVAGRVDPALIELADLLHAHLVGELTVHPGGDADAWRRFLLLVSRSPESVRAEGGISRLWMTMGGRHVEVREVDYGEVLRERRDGHAATWERIVADCLQGSVSLDDDTIDALVEAAGDPERVTELVKMLEARAASGGVRARAAALVQLLRTLVGAVTKTVPERADAALQNVAAALALVSPDVVFELLSQRTADQDAETPRLIGQIAARMPDRVAARILARSLIAEGAATERLAQAFHALVPDRDRHDRMLSMTRDALTEQPDARTLDLDALWRAVVEMVTSYSDSSYVSDAYGRELSGARAQAIHVEQVSDDPPERMAAWLGTIGTSALRALDLALLLDLLRIEQDAGRWRDLMGPVVSQIEDLLLVADFESAEKLVGVITFEAGEEGDQARRPGALGAIDRLVAGPMMRHIVSHLSTIDDMQFERVKALALALGAVIVQPLAELLSTEERSRTRERLTAMLIAFGATGRQTVERLKGSPNALVRRTAIYLMREFGGTEALPDLARLLDDSEPQVQREAVRAILNMGTDAAYDVLQQALSTSSTESREAIMQAIALVRDERATPLLAYILRHVDHRGPLRTIYQRAIESLGALRDREGVEPLREALYRGEWWAPRRTAELRAAAADALARIGSTEALGVLETAAESGSRGVRSVARASLHRSAAAARGR